ncbi:MAG: aromatic amino acid ammonia-lyase [Armatimonadaceae bacterium]
MNMVSSGAALLSSRAVRTQPLGPDVLLTCREVEEIACLHPGTQPALTEAALAAMEESRACRARLETAGVPIYGTTTGFGPFVTYASGDNGRGLQQHGAGLLDHLGAGWGPANAPWTEPEVVIAAMWVRVQNLAQGWSGISPNLISAYLRLPATGIVPCVPPVGSVGASGDLIPLAHIARAFVGAEDAWVRYQGGILPAREALHRAQLNLPQLEGREALALTNGTSFLTAFAALATARAERLLATAERLTGWMYRLLGARTPALNPALHQARGHHGQMVSAENIRLAAYGDENPMLSEDSSRPLQEVYSIRCAPQVLGACRDQIEYARQVIETEINGVSDNPLFDTAQEAVLHGGNFQGQQVAFAADALNAALTQIAVLAERQVDALVTPSRTNEHAPLLLSACPGASSGLAGAQITATALVAEMRSRAQMHATFSIPTNGDNQDVVSMGTLAARAAFEQTERLAGVLAVLTMALAQLTHLRSRGLAAGNPCPVPAGIPEFVGVDSDRPLHTDLMRISRHFLLPEPGSKETPS